MIDYIRLILGLPFLLLAAPLIAITYHISGRNNDSKLERIVGGLSAVLWMDDA